MNDQTSMATEDALEPQSMAPFFGSLASGVALTFVARLFTLGSALAASIIVARWLGAEGTGTLAVLNVTAALASQFGSAGIPSATTYFVAKNRSLAPAVWANGVGFSLIIGAAIAIGIVAGANLQPTLFNGVSSRLLAIVAISIPFQLVTLVGLNLLLAIDRIKLMNALDALASVFLLLNAIAVLIIWRRGLAMLVSANTAINVVLGGLIILFVRRASQQSAVPTATPRLSLLKQMLVYGFKFYVSIFAMFVIFRADLLIVNHFRGADAAGVYAIAGQFSFLLIMLPAVIASLLFPRVAARQDETATYAVEVTRHTSFVMLIVCLVAAAAAFALPLVYGTRFSDATIQLLILLPGVFFISLESVLVQHFTGTGLPPIIPGFWILTMLGNIGLNLAFVPRWGARAAAVNSTISYAFIFVLVTAYFSRRTGHNPFLVCAPRTFEFRNLFAKLQSRAFAK